MGTPTLLARAAKKTGREGERSPTVTGVMASGGFERAWAGSRLVAVGGGDTGDERAGCYWAGTKRPQ